jgi:uncharacterized membrane protein YphA (DoxX/SURF4 family)
MERNGLIYFLAHIVMNKIMSVIYMDVTKIAIILFFVMFVYSGFTKILKFNDKVLRLGKKTGLPHIINVLGMVGVIILEIVGSLLLVAYFMKDNTVSRNLAKQITVMFLLFLAVVTMLYHPPWDKMIPFLSNVTTFAGTMLIYDKI